MTEMKRCFSKLKVLLLTPLLLAILVGCTQRPLVSPETDSSVVNFHSGSLSVADVTSKAEIDLPENTTVRVLVFRGGDYETENTYRITSAGEFIPCTVDAAGAYVGTGDALKLAVGQYNFYAYAPAVATDAAHAVISGGISHEVDLLGATAVADKAITSSSSTVALSFTHKMSKVSVEVKPSDGYLLTSISVTSATLGVMAGVPGVYTIATNTLTAGGGNSTATISSFSASDAVTSSGSVIVMPKTAADFTLTMVLSVDGDPKTLTGTVSNIALEAGSHYSFTARVAPGEMGLYIKVLDWNEVDYTNGTVGEGQLLVGKWVYSDDSQSIGEDEIVTGQWVYIPVADEMG